MIYDGELLADIPGACLDDYVSSLERLRELPVRVVHAGHEGSFGRAALLEMIATCLAAWRA
ncbi:hypothetical protein D3C81_2162960 [compost metagenome]